MYPLFFFYNNWRVKNKKGKYFGPFPCSPQLLYFTSYQRFKKLVLSLELPLKYFLRDRYVLLRIIDSTEKYIRHRVSDTSLPF